MGRSQNAFLRPVAPVGYNAKRLVCLPAQEGRNFEFVVQRTLGGNGAAVRIEVALLRPVGRLLGLGLRTSAGDGRARLRRHLALLRLRLAGGRTLNRRRLTMRLGGRFLASA